MLQFAGNGKKSNRWMVGKKVGLDYKCWAGLAVVVGEVAVTIVPRFNASPLPRVDLVRPGISSRLHFGGGRARVGGILRRIQDGERPEPIPIRDGTPWPASLRDDGGRVPLKDSQWRRPITRSSYHYRYMLHVTCSASSLGSSEPIRSPIAPRAEHKDRRIPGVPSC